MTFVTWKWSRPGYRSTFTGAHVNRLAAMLARHYARPHRVVCVTNDAAGIDPAVVIVPDRADFADIPSVHGGANPSCFRRLRMWHPDAAQWFGERFASLDLDLVITRDVTGIFDRGEDFVAYRDPYYPRQYNGSLMLLRAGARPDVWEAFDPDRSPQIARGVGFVGSDQAWISLRAFGAPTWSEEDGIYSYRRDIEPRGGALPADARIVVMHGNTDPWSPAAQALPWVREHWGEV